MLCQERHNYTTKKNKVTGYTVLIKHFGAFKFHLRQLANKEKEEVEESLKKSFACWSRATVIVSEEKPALISFKCSTNTITVRCVSAASNLGNKTALIGGVFKRVLQHRKNGYKRNIKYKLTYKLTYK